MTNVGHEDVEMRDVRQCGIEYFADKMRTTVLGEQSRVVQLPAAERCMRAATEGKLCAMRSNMAVWTMRATAAVKCVFSAIAARRRRATRVKRADALQWRNSNVLHYRFAGAMKGVVVSCAMQCGRGHGGRVSSAAATRDLRLRCSSRADGGGVFVVAHPRDRAYVESLNVQKQRPFKWNRALRCIA